MRRITFGIIALAAVILTVAIGYTVANRPEETPVVRADSHVLQTASGGVTVVEFLDFECPACRQVYPEVEKLRKEYAGKVTYVVRMFPLASHQQAEPAARAAQAAANQGKFEAMYRKLFEGDQLTDFAVYAREIGLDMDRFHADMGAKSTADAVEADRKDGLALKVRGTPTFFVNGEQVEFAGLRTAIEGALR